jgi:hypothetical protein
MKQSLILLLAMCVTLLGTSAWSANPDTGPGCGLGKLAWSDFKGQKQIAPQVMMATTNVIGVYTFAIPFGTSGCKNDGVILRTERVNVFADVTFEDLAQDMARGEGEYLASLADLLGVLPEQRSAFFTLARERYTTVLATGKPSAVAMLKTIHDAMDSHPLFAKASGRP